MEHNKPFPHLNNRDEALEWVSTLRKGALILRFTKTKEYIRTTFLGTKETSQIFYQDENGAKRYKTEVVNVAPLGGTCAKENNQSFKILYEVGSIFLCEGKLCNSAQRITNKSSLIKVIFEGESIEKAVRVENLIPLEHCDIAKYILPKLASEAITENRSADLDVLANTAANLETKSKQVVPDEIENGEDVISTNEQNANPQSGLQALFQAVTTQQSSSSKQAEQ